MSKVYTVKCERDNRSPMSFVGTVNDLVENAFGYTLECGASWSHERGRSKINCKPKSINALINNLNKAVNNSASNGYAGKHYSVVE